MSATYYAATADPAPAHPPLQGSVTADLCIIGGGCTGMAAALFAAQKGYNVVLLEAGRIGGGASGRNGGQIIPGLRMGPRALLRRFGRSTGRDLFALSMTARDLVTDLIRRFGISCDLVLQGHLYASRQHRHLDALKREADLAAESYDYPFWQALDRKEMDDEIDSPLYRCGLLDQRGGHFHPLNYALGLAAACRTAGVVLHEDSKVLSVSSTKEGVTFQTNEGRLQGKFGLLACDALIGRLQGDLADRMMPITSHIVTTYPLPLDRLPIRRNRAVSDDLFAVNYFRRTADNRLLFGGGERYLPGPAKDIDALVRRPLGQVFPQWGDAAFSHRWDGQVSITRSRLPDIGRKGPLFYAQGYSGQGAILSTLCGNIIADAMAGTAEKFDLFARMAPRPFPGGRHLRTPLHLLGMFYYGLRDRLG